MDTQATHQDNVSEALSAKRAEAKYRIVFLDYLRIFAFMSVLCGHKFFDDLVPVLEDPNVHGTLKTILGFLMHFIAGGGAGVVVFFLVSGYIICHVLQHQKPLEFAIKRVFRIYPLLVFAIALEALYNYFYNDVTPVASVLVPQMLLIGDFFSTPYALRGVEWTLRVEIMFYLFMGILKALKLMDEGQKALPWVLVLATIVLASFAPFPVEKHWAHGYFTIYGVFLFVGAMWYLWEKGRISSHFLAVYLIAVMLQHYNMIEAYQPFWLKAPFATLAVALFAFTWVVRDKLEVTPLVLLFSELTYTVYLFHNWLWDWIRTVVDNWNISVLPKDVQIMLILFAICYSIVIAIERPFIRIGKIAAKKVKQAVG